MCKVYYLKLYQFPFLDIISPIKSPTSKDPNLAAALAATLEARRLKSKRVWVLVRARPSDGISCIAIVSWRIGWMKMKIWRFLPIFVGTHWKKHELLYSLKLVQFLQYRVDFDSLGWRIFSIMIRRYVSRRIHSPSANRPRIGIKWSSATPTVLRPPSFSTRCEAYIIPLINPKHRSSNGMIF